MTVGHAFRNVAELALGGKLSAMKNPTFNRIFDVKVFNPECRASPELAQKYGIAMDNVQQVVAIQNLVTSDLTWWNPARKTKPQNFKSTAAAATTTVAAGIHDPTGGGGPSTCDFCGWQNLTAEDTFGRVEGPYAVTASNLFKYGAPFQGIVLFKHHDPLRFNLPQLCDLLTVADGWFQKAVLAAQAQDEEQQQQQNLFPLLVWNCLGRAGASQFHGHAQVMVSGAPFPAMKRESEAIKQYTIQHSDELEACYYQDLVEAHSVAGLARRLVVPSDEILWDDKVLEENTAPTATAHVSLCPTKDAEIVIHGDSLTCPAFQILFYAALRALIDELGVESFNAGINNIPLITSIKENCDSNSNSASNKPIVARVVSRGRASGGASDFGGLEVFAGASIGHTDPWIVMQALDTSLQRAIQEY